MRTLIETTFQPESSAGVSQRLFRTARRRPVETQDALKQSLEIRVIEARLGVLKAASEVMSSSWDWPTTAIKGLREALSHLETVTEQLKVSHPSSYIFNLPEV